MERLEDLGLNGLKIYQDDGLYCFTSDAVLLSKFATVKKGDVVADFCSGSGIVGLHLYGLNPVIESVTLFEMQSTLATLSKKSILENGLQDKFSVFNSRVQDIGKEFNEKFSLVVCNPPYMQCGRGEENKNPSVAMCRAEIYLTLEELIKSVARSLKFGGRFAMIHRADRLVDAITLMRQNNIEPKRLAFISGANKPPYTFMIEGVKGGKVGLKVLPTINN